MKNKSVAEQTIAYIKDNLGGDLTLGKIAEELHYSKFYLARAFSENTGCSVYQYIKRCRLEQAAWRLARTNQPIVEIAYEAHYNSQQAFTLAFRQLYLCTPQIYRQTHRQTHRIDMLERGIAA